MSPLATEVDAPPDLDAPADGRPDPRVVLVDRMPPWARASRAALVYAAVFGVSFWLLSWRPLWHTDVWGHLAYGRMIVADRAIPLTEPLMPLAQGMPFIDTAWLSQVLAAEIYSAAGITALQAVFALLILGGLALLAQRLHERTHSVAWTLLGLVACTWLSWSQWFEGPQRAAILRPQLAGWLCYAALFSCLVRAPRRTDWLVVPGLMCLWANLHGSFVVGLVMLAAFWMGHVVDVARKTRSVSRAVRDPGSVRLMLWTELAAVAALLNPYGFQLYTEVFTFSRNPNLAQLVEWDALRIRSSQGTAAAGAILLLVLCYRASPRRVRAVEFFLIAGLGLWAAWTSRMIVWWGLPVAYYLTIHARAVVRRWQRAEFETPVVERNGLQFVLCVGLLWIGFALSPFSNRLLHGKEPALRRLVSRGTPVRAVEYLQKNPPQGLVFNTYEWGDYLAWAGPAGIKVFAASHAHLIPQEVWKNYLSISNGSGNWDDLLDRYSVNTVVIDMPERNNLIRLLRGSAKWKVGYEDGLAVVFVRKKPL